MEVSVRNDGPLMRAVVGSLIVNVLTLVLFALPGANNIPSGAKAVAVFLAVLAVAGAYGLVQRERWGWWITLVVTVFNVVTSVPGLFDWPSTAVGIAIIVCTIAGVGVIVLLFRRDVRHLTS